MAQKASKISQVTEWGSESAVEFGFTIRELYSNWRQFVLSRFQEIGNGKHCSVGGNVNTRTATETGLILTGLAYRRRRFITK